MFRHIHPLLVAVSAGSLAAAMVLSQSAPASAAGACIEQPNRHIDQSSHWYYRNDRAHHRKCWFLETSELTTPPIAFADPTPAPFADSMPSWFSRLSTRWEQNVSTEFRQNSMVNDSSSVTKARSPKPRKPAKIARKERSRIAPPPETNGAAIAARHDQLLSQTSKEVGNNTSALTPINREALFENFLQWYVKKNTLSGK